jgi:pimeloyl-ACP methyl ester carboxylesterase
VADDADRFDVRSADGTSIAVWVDGSGPPLLLVHGAISDHRFDDLFVAELRDGFTTFAMDRRGRGESGDAPEYAIEREFEDVAAVVDAVATRTGNTVAVWGHSYGADCAMGAVTRTRHIGHLVLYEPGLGIPCPPGPVEAVEAAVAAGDLEAATVTLLREIVEMTDEEIDYMRAMPMWPTRVEIVPSTPREVRAESSWVYRPGQFDALTATTLILAGSASPPAQADATERAAQAIRGARVHVLEGHGHIAHRTDPAMVAAIVREFVLG